jgi:hypothetical protein
MRATQSCTESAAVHALRCASAACRLAFRRRKEAATPAATLASTVRFDVTSWSSVTFLHALSTWSGWVAGRGGSTDLDPRSELSSDLASGACCSATALDE